MRICRARAYNVKCVFFLRIEHGDRGTARVASGVSQNIYREKGGEGGGKEGRFIFFSGMYDLVPFFSPLPSHGREC